jgi:hypothetical protein
MQVQIDLGEPIVDPASGGSGGTMNSCNLPCDSFEDCPLIPDLGQFCITGCCVELP